MLNSLKNIFKQSENETQENNSKKQLSLLCGLMLEAAQVDGKIDQIEIDQISKILTENFQEDQSAVELELQSSLKEINYQKGDLLPDYSIKTQLETYNPIVKKPYQFFIGSALSSINNNLYTKITFNTFYHNKYLNLNLELDQYFAINSSCISPCE